ncbi:MAG: hypothetical protein M0Z60_14940 [Nitrospiraceae bacterium]|nr:hypothetical protein [Nitrospiraceae bacterium]
MGNALHTTLGRLAVNSKLLAIKAYGAVVRLLPARTLVIEGIGSMAGVLSMFLHAGQWGPIGRFAGHIGYERTKRRFILRYFLRKGKDLAWELSGYELPLDPTDYAAIEGSELLEQSLRAGKGAILIGAHYGPSLYLHTLHSLSADVRVLVAPGRLDYWDRFESLGAARLQRRMFSFLQSRSLAAGKEERSLLSHLRAGGAVFMDIDTPGPRKEEQTVPFLGARMAPHLFPFELSLKYRSPVFFCLFEEDRKRPYRFRICPCSPFSAASDGFREYIAFVEKKILSCPFMWSLVPHFFDMFATAAPGMPSCPAKTGPR